MDNSIMRQDGGGNPLKWDWTGKEEAELARVCRENLLELLAVHDGLAEDVAKLLSDDIYGRTMAMRLRELRHDLIWRGGWDQKTCDKFRLEHLWPEYDCDILASDERAQLKWLADVLRDTLLHEVMISPNPAMLEDWALDRTDLPKNVDRIGDLLNVLNMASEPLLRLIEAELATVA